MLMWGIVGYLWVTEILNTSNPYPCDVHAIFITPSFSIKDPLWLFKFFIILIPYMNSPKYWISHFYICHLFFGNNKAF